MSDVNNNAPLPMRAPMVAGAPILAIIPRDNAEAARLAEAFVTAGMVPESVKGKTTDETRAKVMLVLLKGMEIGIPPVTAMETIMVINGRTALWGDGAAALIHRSGKMEYIKSRYEGKAGDEVCIVTVKRRGSDEEVTRSFSMADARAASLLGKGPWRAYPLRMLFNRARAWAFRDAFADVLMGMSIVEELQDIPAPPTQASLSSNAQLNAEDIVAALPTAEQPKEEPPADTFVPCPACSGSGGDNQCEQCGGTGDVPAASA